MAIRMARFMTGRSCAADDTKVAAVLPIFTGERGKSLYMDFKAVSRGTGFGGITGTPSSYPDQFNEINVHALWVPWHIMQTHHGVNRADSPEEFDSADDWDKLFRNLLFEWQSNGNEYYGGDADADPLIYTQHDDAASSSADASEAESVAAMGSMGPLGIIRLFGREVWADNEVTDGDGKVRQSVQYEVSLPLAMPGPGFVIVGVVRYEHAAETNFNYEVTNDARKRARNMLIGGDLMRVQAHIEKNTSSEGDWIRTVLFGGDAYIEADTVKGENMKLYAKGVFTVETPYSLQRF